jgi:parallel beta-helix repeat protein
MRRSTLLASLSLLTLLGTACSDHPQPLQPDAAQPQTASRGASVVQVAPPTGVYPADRLSIEAALAQVQPGGTLHFAPGTYVIGNPEPFSWDFLRVTVPGITLSGHPDGTTLRGCAPAQIDQANCNGLELSGGHQAVRGFTFEGMWVAVLLGNFALEPSENTVGGYLVEDNSFQNSVVGVAPWGGWQEPAVIRNNTFRNLAFAVEAYGRTYHVLENDFANPEPVSIPGSDRGWWAIRAVSYTVACDHNIFAGNRIEGFVDGIGLESWGGRKCSHNEIRENTIHASGAFDLEGWTAEAIYLSDTSQGDGFVENNLVEANTVLGAEGTGIGLYWASRNQFANNTVSGVKPMRYELRYEGNGVTVWAGEQNQITGNTFDDPAIWPIDIGSVAVLLLGNQNHVGTTRATDWVRDLGVGNTVSGPGHVSPHAASASGAAAKRGDVPRKLRERGALGAVLQQREALRTAPR